MQAGYTNQGSNAIAIGMQAGNNIQGNYAIALGRQTGYTNQGNYAIAIGNYAGSINQSTNAVAIGNYAGQTNQGNYAIAIGYNAGYNNQSNSAVAIGMLAGYTNQGSNAIAIGTNAGRNNQSNYAIAIGNYAGDTNQHSNTIIINARKNPLNSISTNSLYISPIRSISTLTSETTYEQLYYNSTTSEIISYPIRQAGTATTSGNFINIVFSPAFGTVPYVVATATTTGNTGYFMTVNTITKTGFTANSYNGQSRAGSITFNWIAMV